MIDLGCQRHGGRKPMTQHRDRSAEMTHCRGILRTRMDARARRPIVAIVDDVDAQRRAWTRLLGHACPEVELVAFSGFDEAIASCDEPFDAWLLDCDLGEGSDRSGVEIACRLRARSATRVLLFSHHGFDTMRVDPRALLFQACSKSESDRVIAYVRAATAGENDADYRRAVAEGRDYAVAIAARGYAWSDAEAAIARGILDDRTYLQLSSERGVTVRTIKNQWASCCRKADRASGTLRADLVALATRYACRPQTDRFFEAPSDTTQRS